MKSIVVVIAVCIYCVIPAWADEAYDAYERKDYTTAFRLWKKAADKGNVDAQFYLGEMYFYGHGVDQSDSEAFSWYRRAAEQGDSFAQYYLGWMYENGRGVKQSYTEAVFWYRKAAEQDFADAQFNLGNMYYDGRGVNQSYSDAVYWYLKAAKQGHADAQVNLGIIYEYGYGVEQSSSEAFSWCLRAAEQGNATAQLYLSVMYEEGRGIEQSDSEAVSWCHKAAEQGNANAQLNLARMYKEGKCVGQSDSEAYYWCRKAAEQGVAIAQNNLGRMYDEGRGVEQSYSEAASWYRKAAEQGLADAQVMLGWMYSEGRGVMQSDSEAASWYCKAADQGNVYAQLKLGYMYFVGKGVIKNYSESLAWNLKAADQGDSQAELNIGELYEYGLGARANYTESLNWYRRAAEHGEPDAKKAVDRLDRKIWGAASLQKLLSEQGFYKGSIDGVMGDKTIEAAQRYHIEANLKIGEYNLTGMHSALSEKMASTERPVDFGSYYAVVIGNKRYKHLKNLKTAENDAEEVASILHEKYNFKVMLLRDAKGSDIIDALNKCRRELKTTDNLLIYYAGYGIKDQATGKEYWMPINSKSDNSSKWISINDIAKFLDEMAAGHVLVVADSCFTGTHPRAPVKIEDLSGSHKEWIEIMSKNKSRTVLASGSLEPVPIQDGSKHSAFAKAFMNALLENNVIIGVGVLYEKIRNQPMGEPNQTPVYSDMRSTHQNEGDFILIPENAR